MVLGSGQQLLPPFRQSAQQGRSITGLQRAVSRVIAFGQEVSAALSMTFVNGAPVLVLSPTLPALKSWRAQARGRFPTHRSAGTSSESSTRASGARRAPRAP